MARRLCHFFRPRPYAASEGPNGVACHAQFRLRTGSGPSHCHCQHARRHATKKGRRLLRAPVRVRAARRAARRPRVQRSRRPRQLPHGTTRRTPRGAAGAAATSAGARTTACALLVASARPALRSRRRTRMALPQPARRGGSGSPRLPGPPATRTQMNVTKLGQTRWQLAGRRGALTVPQRGEERVQAVVDRHTALLALHVRVQRLRPRACVWGWGHPAAGRHPRAVSAVCGRRFAKLGCHGGPNIGSGPPPALPQRCVQRPEKGALRELAHRHFAPGPPKSTSLTRFPCGCAQGRTSITSSRTSRALQAPMARAVHCQPTPRERRLRPRHTHAARRRGAATTGMCAGAGAQPQAAHLGGHSGHVRRPGDERQQRGEHVEGYLFEQLPGRRGRRGGATQPSGNRSAGGRQHTCTRARSEASDLVPH